MKEGATSISDSVVSVSSDETGATSIAKSMAASVRRGSAASVQATEQCGEHAVSV
jgi:hypothetical protein